MAVGARGAEPKLVRLQPGPKSGWAAEPRAPLLYKRPIDRLGRHALMRTWPDWPATSQARNRCCGGELGPARGQFRQVGSTVYPEASVSVRCPVQRSSILPNRHSKSAIAQVAMSVDLGRCSDARSAREAVARPDGGRAPADETQPWRATAHCRAIRRMLEAPSVPLPSGHAQHHQRYREEAKWQRPTSKRTR